MVRSKCVCAILILEQKESKRGTQREDSPLMDGKAGINGFGSNSAQSATVDLLGANVLPANPLSVAH